MAKESTQIFKLELSTEFGYRPNYIFRQTNDFFIPYGEDNQMDAHIQKLAATAPTHSSLLKLEQNLVYGDSWLFDESNTALNDFINANNLHKVLDRCVHDFVRYGGNYLQCIWSRDGKTIAQVEHQDFSSIRINNELVLEPNSFHVCFDWSEYRKYGTKQISAFKPFNAKSEPVQLLYTREYESKTKFYPQIPYASSIKMIALESALNTLSFNSVKKGLATSGMFLFKEVNDPEERKALKANIKKDLVGEDGQTYIAVFSQSKDTAPEFIPITTDNKSDMIKTLNDLAVQKILTSHRCGSPSLACLPGEGSVFTNEKSTAYEYYQSLVIKDIQQEILEPFIRIFLINGLIKNKSEVSIRQLNPIQFRADSNVLLQTMHINEIRKHLLGLPPVEDGDKIAGISAPMTGISPTLTPVNDISKQINPKDVA